MENKVHIIAEMACSHEGKPELAKRIIDGAGEAGADAIQLQIWSLQYMMTSSHPIYDLCRKLEMTHDQWRDIVNYSRAKYPKMDIYSFVYEHKSIDFTESLGLDGYKLSSADLSNPLVLDCVAKTGKKINLSIGASTLDEIRNGIERVRKHSDAPITMMYGFQSFPTAIEKINLNYMMKIKDMFGLPIGYQDHCDADDTNAFRIPALSVGMGVSVLEKHITHDRSLKGTDYQSALNPDEFKNFVDMVRGLEAAKGVSEPEGFSEEEIKYREFQKKSVVASREIKSGETLREEDVVFLRTDELGLAPDKTENLLGKTVNRNIALHQLIRQEDLS